LDDVEAARDVLAGEGHADDQSQAAFERPAVVD
jgi:hypothetical protein